MGVLKFDDVTWSVSRVSESWHGALHSRCFRANTFGSGRGSETASETFDDHSSSASLGKRNYQLNPMNYCRRAPMEPCFIVTSGDVF